MRTNRRGRDVVGGSESINLFPDRWRTVWRVDGKRTARFAFRVPAEGVIGALERTGLAWDVVRIGHDRQDSKRIDRAA